MITSTEKAILQDQIINIRKKSQDGNTVKVAEKAGSKYKNQVKFRVKVKARKELSDLELLARIYPRAIDVEILLKIIESYLNQENFKITKRERTRKVLPRSLKDKFPESVISDFVRTLNGREIVACGSLREKSRGKTDKSPGRHGGATLRKNCGQEAYLCMMLLKIVKKSLDDSTLTNEPLQNEALLLAHKNGEFSLTKYLI